MQQKGRAMEIYDAGKIMRMKREALGYTRKQICERFPDISEKTLARLEKGTERVRWGNIQKLLEFYHQRSFAIYPILDLKNPNAMGMYSDILVLIFQKNYKEAERKLEILEQCVNKESKESLSHLEVLKRGLQHLIGKEEVDGKETILFFEKVIAGMMPEGVALEKWPLNKQELFTYMLFLNVLASEKQHERIIQITRKLLANIEQGYMSKMMFADFHGCFTRRLIRSLHEQKQCDEIVELAKKSLEICAEVGDISNTYRIQGELLNYYWENDFFHDDELKKQCLEDAVDMYYLCGVCGDETKKHEFKVYLEIAHGYTDLL